MNNRKKEFAREQEALVSRRNKFREYWGNHMRALQERKISRGAAQIYRIVKSRFKWGSKDIDHDDEKSHHKT